MLNLANGERGPKPLASAVVKHHAAATAIAAIAMNVDVTWTNAATDMFNANRASK